MEQSKEKRRSVGRKRSGATTAAKETTGVENADRRAGASDAMKQGQISTRYMERMPERSKIEVRRELNGSRMEGRKTEVVKWEESQIKKVKVKGKEKPNK